MKKNIAVPTLFLRDRVLPPRLIAELFVGREKSKAAIDAALRANSLVFLPLQKNDTDDPLPAEVYNLGALAHIQSNSEFPDGTYKLSIEIKSMARMVDCSLREGFWQSDILPIQHKEDARRLQKLKSDLIKLIQQHSSAFETAVTTHLSTIPNKSSATREFRAYVDAKNPQPSFTTLTFPVGQPKSLLYTNRLVGIALASLARPISPRISPKVFKARTSTSRSSRVKFDGSDVVQLAINEVLDKHAIFRLPIRLPDKEKLKGKFGLSNVIDGVISQGVHSNEIKQRLLADGQLKNIARLISEQIIRETKNLEAFPQKADNNAPEIFVSHLGSDKRRIRPILLGLLGAGFRLFIDKPHDLDLEGHPNVRGIGSGPFRNEISNALRASSCVLCLWSTAATEHRRTEMHEEASFGKDRGILVQAAIENFGEVLQRLPLGFKEWQLFDLSKTLLNQNDNLPADISLLSREINDVIRRNPNTNSPMEPWKQASASVGMAVVQQQLRTLPKPPPPVPTATYSSLEDLRRLFVGRTQKLAQRLSTSNHPMERDVADVLQDIIQTFGQQLDEIDLAVAPSLGELLNVLCETYSDPELRRELAPHVLPALKLAASAYEAFASKWSAWSDQRSDPARELVTPENADRTREAADVVIEFARSASVVHRSVPDVLIALRQLIKPALSFSQFNEYRYLNAIGEGLRACWNEGERYINDHWSEIQKSFSLRQPPNIGPFNEFFLEMAETLIKLSQANPALFGWLFVRVGYLKRLKAGDLLSEL